MGQGGAPDTTALVGDIDAATGEGAEAPPPAPQGDLLVDVLGLIGIGFGALVELEQRLTAPLGAIPWGPFPAMRMNDIVIGAPHAHMPIPIPLPPFLFPRMTWLPQPGVILEVPYFSGAVSVMINGIPAARCGDMGITAPLCLGFMPAFEVFFGSANVWLEGARAARVLDPTRHCILFDPPVSFLSLGIGVAGSGNVMVGGIPLPSLTNFVVGKVFEGVFSGLFAVARRLARALRLDRLARAAANRAGRFFAHPRFDRLRNMFTRARCFLTGHPVDVATGRVLTSEIDWRLGGAAPIVFERQYLSSWSHRGSPLGPGWSHTYDQAVWAEEDRLVHRTGDGREIEFFPDQTDGEPPRPGAALTDPVSRLTLRSLGEDRWEIEEPSGQRSTFAPCPGDPQPGVARLASIEQPDGLTIRFEYDHGKLTYIIDPARRIVRLEYDAGGRLAQVFLPHPSQDGWVPQARYVYSKEGDLAEVHDALGHVTRYVYDDHLLIQETDRAGLSFYFDYDGRGPEAYCIRTWGDGGIYDHSLVYDRPGRTTHVTDSLGATTIYEMNEVFAVTQVTRPDGAQTRYTYDAALAVESITDPLGQVMRFERDAQGRVVRTIHPDGTVERRELDARGRQTRLVKRSGAEWQFAYDARGLLIEEIDPLGGKTRYERDGRGLVAAIETPAGGRTTFTRDAAGAVVSRRSPGGSVTRFGRDRRSRLLSVRDAAGNEARFTYDACGRVVVMDQGPLGASRRIQYDEVGCTLSVEDSERGVTRLSYTGKHLVASCASPGRSVRVRYDTEGRIVEVLNAAGQAHRFERDACGRVTRESAFDGRVTRYSYDRCGRLVKVTKPSGATTEIARDTARRTVEIARSDGTRDVLRYDLDGRLAEAENASAKICFERDRMGRIVAERRGDVWVTSRYDEVGSRVGLESSMGARVGIRRGSRREVRSVHVDGQGAWRTDFEYDEIGREVEQSLPGDVAVHMEYGPDGRPRRQTVRWHGDESVEREWVWGATGRSLEVRGADGSSVYHYDDAARLISAEHGDGTLVRRALGWAGSHAAGAPNRTYGAGGRPEVIDGIRYVYDTDGQLHERVMPDGKVWRYSFDVAGMLREVTRPDGERVSFEYDAMGRRLQKKARGGTTRWTWDQSAVLHEQSSSAASHRTWIFRPESAVPLAQIEGGAAYGVMTDRAGAPSALRDAGGSVVWRMQLDVHGGARREDSTGPRCPWRAPGQYADEETGLHYNRHRYFDPASGAFISPDLLGLTGGLDAYAYVEDPLEQVDPFGLDACLTDLYGPSRRFKYAKDWEKLADGTVQINPTLQRSLDGPIVLEPGQSYLWGIDPNGQVLVAQEVLADGASESYMTLGHPTLNGGELLNAGEMNWDAASNGWVINAESGRYNMPTYDPVTLDLVSPALPEHLENARDLLSKILGFDVGIG